MSRDADRDIRELYALSPAEFTRARDARAAALKAAGRTAAADAVRQLRRPTPALWAANQLARLESDSLEAFIRTVDAVRRTQLRDPRAAAEALRRQRADLDTLVSRAVGLLAGPGRSATPATQRRIADTLLGAAVDRDRAQALREGRLTTELSAPGFEVLTGAPGGGHLRLVPASGSGGETQISRRAQRAVDRDAALRERRAQREAAAQQEREQRRRAAEALEREAAARDAAAEAARRDLEDLTRQTRAARDRLREAQRAARAASGAGRKARRPNNRRS